MRAIRSVTVSVTALFVLFAQPHVSTASSPETFTTARLPQAQVPGTGEVIISADAGKTPTGTLHLTFQLQGLPPQAELLSCGLRVVMSREKSANQSTGVLVELLSSIGGTIAGLLVPPQNLPAGTALVFRSVSLCGALTAALGSDAPTVSMSLQTQTRDGILAIRGAGPRIPTDKLPRLILTYRVADSMPGTGDWRQVRAGPQHPGRTDWRIYDPEGAYGPTRYRAVEMTGVTSLHLPQSPLLFDGALVAATQKGDSAYGLTQYYPGGHLTAQLPDQSIPKFIGASATGTLLSASHNRFTVADLRPDLRIRTGDVPVLANGEIIMQAPTIGADGALFAVTNRFIRAYAAAPDFRPLWDYDISDVPEAVSSLAFSEDGRTAYVLIGDPRHQILALDATTGVCKWRQSLPRKIKRGLNENMPVPVVAGARIFATDHDPTGSALNAFYDPDRMPNPASGAIIPPSTGCEDNPAASYSVMTQSGDFSLSTPVVGKGQEVYYLKDGQFCWAREQEGNCLTVTASQDAQSPGRACDVDKLHRASTLIGDGTGVYFHAVAPAESRAHTGQFFALRAHWVIAAMGPVLASVRCSQSDIQGLSSGLMLAPDGSVYNTGLGPSLLRIVPDAFAAASAVLMVDGQTLRDNDGTLFRAQDTVLLCAVASQCDTPVPFDLMAGQRIRLVSGKMIIFGPGLRIPKGGRLNARVGF